MRTYKLLVSLVFSLALCMFLAGCGGGGGGGSASAASTGTCATASNCTIPSAVSAIPPQN